MISTDCVSRSLWTYCGSVARRRGRERRAPMARVGSSRVIPTLFTPTSATFGVKITASKNMFITSMTNVINHQHVALKGAIWTPSSIKNIMSSISAHKQEEIK